MGKAVAGSEMVIWDDPEVQQPGRQPLEKLGSGGRPGQGD